MKWIWLHDLLLDLKQLAYESAAQLLLGFVLFVALAAIGLLVSVVLG